MKLTAIVSILMLLVTTTAQGNETQENKGDHFTLEFRDKVSRMVYVRIGGSTAPRYVKLFDGANPFTVTDGYCFISAISHDMDDKAIKRNRVYPNHRSPFQYHVGFTAESSQWGIGARGGAAGSYIGARCIKF